MKRWKKSALAAAAAASLFFAAPAPAAAASLTEKLLYGAAAMLFVSKYYSALDDGAQLQFLNQCQQQTGVYDDAAANARVEGIYERLRGSGMIRREYSLYVAPDEEINAFMSLGGVMCVNKGALDSFDDDELAYVMAHELAHGEERHSVSGVKKRVGLTTALNIYLADDPTIASVVLVNVAGNYVSNAVFTKDQEKEADDLGFEYLTAAGYNPGGAAASMAVLRDRYGESSPTGLKAVLAPGNHPATTDRVNKNVKRMYEYSGKHINVKDGWITVNGKKTFQPAALGAYTAEERTYLTAGKLARLWHGGLETEAYYDGNAVICGGESVYTVSGGEDGAAIAAALNEGILKEKK